MMRMAYRRSGGTSLRNVAEALRVEQQICRAHVNRNVEDLIATLGTQALEHPPPVPPELQTRGMTVDQFLEDLSTVENIICGVALYQRWRGEKGERLERTM